MSNKTDGVPKEPTTEPDIDSISRLMDDELEAGEKRQQGGISAIATVMSKIAKDFHGHKGAVRTVRTLEKKDDDELADFMRTFVPLALRRGLFESQPDLVDMLEGNGQPANNSTGRRHPAPDIKPESDDVSKAAGDDDEGDDDDDPAPQKSQQGPKSFTSALENARTHLQSGTKAETGRVEDLSPAQRAEQDAKNKLIDGKAPAAAAKKRASGKPKLGIVAGSDTVVRH